ncbi:MAG: hypothetical protein MR433_11035 [Coriobacteriaceae bacterium]|nr:hypothetical protein [Coriobacteriaceae bacterium]
MDSRLQGGAFLLERIPRIDLCMGPGPAGGFPGSWSTSPRSGMQDDSGIATVSTSPPASIPHMEN